MDFLQNPFHILGATPYDDRHRIGELAEEGALLKDVDECMRASADLTNPRKRLAAEVAWLPGVEAVRADEILSKVYAPVSESDGVSDLTPLARANFLSEKLMRCSPQSHSDITERMHAIADAYEKTDLHRLHADINSSRNVAGFPEVKDRTALTEEVAQRRRYFKKIIRDALNKLLSRELVQAVTTVTEEATNVGERQGLLLIDDLVDSYEADVQTFLEKEGENIQKLIAEIKIRAKEVTQKFGARRMVVDSLPPALRRAEQRRLDKSDKLLGYISLLSDVVRNWDSVAQPIQVSRKSRGLNHEPSYRVAAEVRGLALHLNNEYGRLDIAKNLTSMLQQVFKEVVEVEILISEDVAALAKISLAREHELLQVVNTIKETRRTER